MNFTSIEKPQKTKCISYALFGYDYAKKESGFEFLSFLRGMMLCRRMNRLLYPEWEMIINTDQQTYDAFKDLFNNIDVIIRIHEPAKLCKAMLWRLAPAWDKNPDGTWKWTHLLCRDLDSPATYREVQAVQHWMNNGRTVVHAITDSVSHNIPLLGGMIGFKPQFFCDRFGPTWNDMIMLSGNSGIDFGQKGSDQSFLNHYIYPSFAQPGNDSITQHYVKGMPNTFLMDYHNEIPDLEVGDFALRESNDTAGHIGAAGWYETQMFRFLHKHWDKFEDLAKAEEPYNNIFYWNNEYKKQ